MASINLLQGAGSVNPTRDAYQERSAQLTQQRDAEDKKALDAQTQKDNDFHKVIKYAADGYVDEARHYAQSKGINVPDKIFSNAQTARGLALAGSVHGNDKEAAMKFFQVFEQTGDVNQALQAAPPKDPNDRNFQNTMREYEAKLAAKARYDTAKPNAGFTLSPGQTRFGSGGQELASVAAESQVPSVEEYTAKYVSNYQKDFANSMGAMKRKDINELVKEAAQSHKLIYGATPTPTPDPVSGGQGAAGASVGAGIQQRHLHIVQELVLDGIPPQQILQKLQEAGYNEQQAMALINSAT